MSENNYKVVDKNIYKFMRAMCLNYANSVENDLKNLKIKNNNEKYIRLEELKVEIIHAIAYGSPDPLSDKNYTEDDIICLIKERRTLLNEYLRECRLKDMGGNKEK